MKKSTVSAQAVPAPATARNEIVVYQPDETIRLDVRLENETVWLMQMQLCELFEVVKSNVSYHLKNIFDTEELDYAATVQKIRTVRQEGVRRVVRDMEYFNLDVIISLGYRINSRRGIQFRQWATKVLKEFMLRGYAFNQRLNQLEDKTACQARADACAPFGFAVGESLLRSVASAAHLLSMPSCIVTKPNASAKKGPAGALVLRKVGGRGATALPARKVPADGWQGRFQTAPAARAADDVCMHPARREKGIGYES